jgi:hypothetical protein
VCQYIPHEVDFASLPGSAGKAFPDGGDYKSVSSVVFFLRAIGFQLLFECFDAIHFAGVSMAFLCLLGLLEIANFIVLHHVKLPKPSNFYDFLSIVAYMPRWQQ